MYMTMYKVTSNKAREVYTHMAKEFMIIGE